MIGLFFSGGIYTSVLVFFVCFSFPVVFFLLVELFFFFFPVMFFLEVEEYILGALHTYYTGYIYIRALYICNPFTSERFSSLHFLSPSPNQSGVLIG